MKFYTNTDLIPIWRWLWSRTLLSQVLAGIIVVIVMLGALGRYVLLQLDWIVVFTLASAALGYYFSLYFFRMLCGKKIHNHHLELQNSKSFSSDTSKIWMYIYGLFFALSVVLTVLFNVVWSVISFAGAGMLASATVKGQPIFSANIPQMILSVFASGVALYLSLSRAIGKKFSGGASLNLK